MSSTTTLTATKTPQPSRPQLLGTLSTSASTYPTTSTTTAIRTSFIKSKKMSITQTYYLAHKARAKLSSEASRPDHNLRLLVGHANLLDSLMVELADAEREQESWFNQSVRGASSSRSEERHIQWAETVVEEPEHDWQAEDAEYSDSDSDSDSDLSEDDEEDRDEDIEMADAVPLRRIPSHSSGSLHRYSMQAPLHQYYSYNDDEDMEEDDGEEDYTHLALQRSPSHSASPPELDLDLDSSEDEHMPPSPPTAILSTFTSTTSPEKQAAEQTEDDEEDQQEQDKDAFYTHNQGYYLPSRGPTMVSTIGVY
ncbi:hypothetical protein QBC32DRAFT_55479 [Pseudoneurospora amorphoporcata]|uniref:Protein ECM13 n=1 Tax=Pseudoneurospora amorphoporcata TaxID=241081 RepID=A0AAN6P4Y6_9PEZI|nr:hypothetical protein QBC32DRAFT_55479 [Pseudoneurospora amorphoporcata]